VTYTDEEEQELAEQKKYYAARHAWTRRKELTPKGNMKWDVWFEKKNLLMERKAKEKALYDILQKDTNT
jgi:hypothetical protein